MADSSMANTNASIKEFGSACARMSDAASRAAVALNYFVEQHHDCMNALVSARILRGMGRPDIARYYE